jgi:hypothetical protein
MKRPIVPDFHKKNNKPLNIDENIPEILMGLSAFHGMY